MRSWKTTLSGLGAGVLLVVTGCGTSGGGTTVTTGNPFTLGVIYHSNPPDAPYQWLQGFSAYWKYLNAVGGVDGHQVNLTQFDNQTLAAETVTAFKQLVADDTVLAVTGMDLSSNTAPILPLANTNKIPLFLGTSTLQASVVPTTPWVFESTELFRDSTAVMGAYAKQKGWTKVGLMYFQGDEAQTANAFVQQYLPTLGLQIVTTQFLPTSKGTLDFTAQTLAVKNSGAQVIFALQGPSGFIAIKKAEDTLGMNVPILGNPSGLNESVYMAMGSTFYAADSPWYEDRTAPGWNDMASSLAKYSNVNSPTAPNIGGWVDGKIITQALHLCGKDCTRATFRDSIEKIKNLELGGLMASVTFSAKVHYAPRMSRFHGIGTDGKLVPITAAIPYPPLAT